MGKLEFAPSRDGLHYPNTWPAVPDVTVPTPFGQLGIGNAANGLCGGMAFAVRDLFEARRSPPDDRGTPEPGSPAFRFVVDRLIDSFDVPAGVAHYYAWMNLPTHDAWFGVHGTSWLTVRQEMPKLRATVDAGHPCPLGLVRARGANPGLLGRNHQVLAYGYADDAARTMVWIYDPNHPDDDDVALTFDPSRPQAGTEFVHSSHDGPVFGFFVVPYRPRDPSPLFASTRGGGT